MDSAIMIINQKESFGCFGVQLYEDTQKLLDEIEMKFRSTQCALTLQWIPLTMATGKHGQPLNIPNSCQKEAFLFYLINSPY